MMDDLTCVVYAELNARYLVAADKFYSAMAARKIHSREDYQMKRCTYKEYVRGLMDLQIATDKENDSFDDELNFLASEVHNLADELSFNLGFALERIVQTD